jgi:hypothetical protein
MKEQKSRSNSYVMTVNHHSDEGKEQIKTLRKLVKANSQVNRRVCLAGRLGANNPKAHKYRSRYKHHNGFGAHSHQSIRLSDAAYADVYIYDRY